MKRFKKVYIEIGNICNMSCHFCPPTGRRPLQMSQETFTEILDQIKEYTDYIYLHVKGEPLLHPKLGKFLDISHEKGFKVNMTTNGTLLKKEGSMLLSKPALRQVNISLHSLDANSGFGMTEKEYKDGVFWFVDQAVLQASPLISLRFWNLDEANKDQSHKKQIPKEQRLKSQGKNEDLLQAIERHFGLDYQIKEEVKPGRGIRLAKNVYVNQDYHFEWPDLGAKEDQAGGTCYGLISHVAILADGSVVPCCLDGEGIINLGNIHKETFADILLKQRTIKISEGFRNHQVLEELCLKCGYRQQKNYKKKGRPL